MTRRFSLFFATAFVFATVLSLVHPALASADPRDFSLNNRGDHTIVGMWVSRHSNNSWGSQILDEAIDPGQYSDISFSGAASTCYYDIRVQYGDGALRYLWDEDLCDTTAVDSSY